jgi:hypothetical protein
MKRAMLGFALAAMFVATPLATSTSAAAGPSNNTTITLSCKNIDAQVTLTLQTQVGGTDLVTVDNTVLNCGPDSLSGNSRTRVVETTSAPAGAVSVTQFDVVAGGTTGGCPGSSTLPAKFNCAPFANASAQLVVR